jgi:hypothetical protein
MLVGLIQFDMIESEVRGDGLSLAAFIRGASIKGLAVRVVLFLLEYFHCVL